MEGLKIGAKMLAAIVIVAAVIGALSAVLVAGYLPKSDATVYKEFYSAEVAVSVSPSDYINDMRMGKMDGLVVDLRDRASYAAGHLITAVNIPAGEMNEKQLVAAFAKLPANETPITYCYSGYCMLSREVGKALAENGMYAKHMTAGWYEINRDFLNYTVNGTEPGVFVADPSYNPLVCSPNGSGEFNC
jgi:rhodanese-related sulfurtransferase